jgi:hypothetical protein
VGGGGSALCAACATCGGGGVGAMEGVGVTGLPYVRQVPRAAMGEDSVRCFGKRWKLIFVTGWGEGEGGEGG